MKKIILYLICGIIGIYFISCTQLEQFVDEIISDSTRVSNDDKQIFKKNDLETIEEWDYSGDTEKEENISSDNNTGSIKLKKSATNWTKTDCFTSMQKFSVVPGNTYELNFNTYSEIWPPQNVHATVLYYDNNKQLETGEGSSFSQSTINKWENNKLLTKIPNNPKIKYIRIKFCMLPKQSRVADIFVDEIKFIDADENYNANINIKNEFQGSLTRVDKLGNVEIFRNGYWKPFFMFAIYADNKREDWAVYSKQGFNTNMWAPTSSVIRKSKNADLYANFQIEQYFKDVDWVPKNKSKKLEQLDRVINQVKDDGLMSNVIFYYIDNEFYDITDQLSKVIKIIEIQDRDNNNNRMHPIYMLNGAYGQARKYNDLVDITGTYVALDRTDRSMVHNFIGLQVSENQLLPAVIAQINRGVGLNFRPILFGAIAKGAKGLGFWRDGGSGINIEKAQWWNDFPNMVNEIEQMMPLIRESHFTNWTVECDNDAIIFGSRMHKNKGHLIIANPTNSRIVAKLTISDLPYSISSVKDYFTKQIIGDIDNNMIKITIDPHGTKVIRLD